METDVSGFFLVKLVLAKTCDFPISKDEYENAAKNRSVLNSAYALLEKYYAICECFSEFEKSAFDISMNTLLYRSNSIIPFFEGRSLLQRRLLALLTTSSLYLKTAPKHVSDLTGSIDGKRVFSDLKHQICGKDPSFEIFEELRNHAQHVDFPIWSYGLRSNRASEFEHVEHGVSITAQREMVTQRPRRASKKASAIEKLDSRYDLRSGIRDYVDCIARLHHSVWEHVTPCLSEARSNLTILENKWKELNPNETAVGVAACQLTDGSIDKSNKTLYLKLEQDLFLEHLETRTRGKRNLKQQRVSQE